MSSIPPGRLFVQRGVGKSDSLDGRFQFRGCKVFNLLMRYAPWGEGRDVAFLGRMFEYTEDDVTARFQRDGQPLLNKLIELPCLFMHEGTTDQIARVGKITRARINGKKVALEFTYESDIPPLLNNFVYENRTEFDMAEDLEFSRSHWAIKDVDLFRVLLRNSQPRRQRPSVFTIPEHEKIDPVLVSAMMPFDASFAAVFDGLKAAAAAAELRCRRADDIWENPSIIADIVSLIDRSRVVICDCTGRNPNVFYEIGIAHTLGREVILITQNEGDIPFDLRHLRYVKYLDNKEGLAALTTTLQARLSALVGEGKD
jgi:hypothetical protein